MAQKSVIAESEARAIDLAGVSPVASAGIASRTLLHSAECRVIHFSFADGQELTTHASSRRAVIQVLEGSGDFLFGDRWQRLAAGMLLHLPPSHPHAVRAAHGPFSMLLTLAAEPAGAAVFPSK